MILLDETEVATLDDPELSTIQESGQHNSFVDIKLIFVSFYSFFVPDTTLFTLASRSIVHFYIYFSNQMM